MSAPSTARDTGIWQHWGILLRLVENYSVGEEWDPWHLWRLPALARADDLPHVGPVVYAALGTGRCMYVGQTSDLHNRFQFHMGISYRRERWQTVAAIALRPTTSANTVNRLEREAATRLRPVDGSSWPRTW